MKKNNIRKIFICLLTFFIIFVFGCSLSTEKNGHDHHNNNNNNTSNGTGPVNITDKTTYYEVELNYTTGVTHFQIGEQYGTKIKQMVPDIEEIFDSYISDFMNYIITLMPFPMQSNFIYQLLMLRTSTLINNGHIPEDYLNEIEGLSKTLCSASNDVLNDGKLSKKELYLMNFILDVLKATQCSAVSVFGADSETNDTLTGRILDWYGGSQNQISRIQALVKFNNNNKSIVSIGYLGYMAGLTIINDNNIFSAILESSTGAAYPIDLTSMHSYSMDLRYAMENFTTINDITNYLKAQSYVAGHLIFLSDPTVSKVLENDLSGTRGLRESTSILNPGIVWGHSNVIASVNSFILNGNNNNHTTSLSNSKRWDSIQTQLGLKLPSVSFNEVKEIMSYDGIENIPGNMSDGDLYNSFTQMIIVYQPSTLYLEVFFRPRTGVLPNNPTFNAIILSF